MKSGPAGRHCQSGGWPLYIGVTVQRLELYCKIKAKAAISGDETA